MHCKTPDNLRGDQLGSLMSTMDSAQAGTLESSSVHWLSPLLALTAHELVSYSEWAKDVQNQLVLCKVADASFGETFRLSLRSNSSRESHTPRTHQADSIIKIIPLHSSHQSACADTLHTVRSSPYVLNPSLPIDVASEIMILQRFSGIPGFAKLRDFRLLRGQAPPGIFNSHNVVDAETQVAMANRSGLASETTPGGRGMEEQVWAVIEMEDAGRDLESLVHSGQFKEVRPIWDVFWQVVFALARGENTAQFEHRDLHLGNICVNGGYDISSGTCSPRSLKQAYTHELLGFSSLRVTLIDYTLSRATLSADITTIVASIDLSLQDRIFSGDGDEAYQYDIYRSMRSALYFSDPTRLMTGLDDAAFAKAVEHTGRSWAQFHPMTNLVWLHYVLNMLLSQITWPSEQLLLSRESKAREDREQTEWNRALELETILLEVHDLLDPAAIGGGADRLYSASDLATYAARKSWMADADMAWKSYANDFTHHDYEKDTTDELARDLNDLTLS